MIGKLRLPHTELDVSALCLGAGSFGTGFAGDRLDRLVSDYIEGGGNFFDTAHCYAFWEENGLGASERELADCLRRLGRVEDAVVATKGGHPDGGERYPRPDAYLAPEVLASDIGESLSRLGFDRIDLYYLHRDDSRVPVGEIMDALNREIERGRLRCIGASNWSIERIAAANDYARRNGLQPFVASQLQWSLALPNWTPGPDPTTRFVGTEEADWHAVAGVPIIPYSATAGGYFAGTGHREGGLYENPVSRERFRRAVELAERLKITPTQVALAYLMHQDATVVPIFGTTSREHLSEALGSADLSLTPEQVRWLRDGGSA